MGGLVYTTGKVDEAPNVFELLVSAKTAFDAAMKAVDASDAAVSAASIEMLRRRVVTPMGQMLAELEASVDVAVLHMEQTNRNVSPEQRAQVELWEALRQWVAEAVLAMQEPFEKLLDVALKGLEVRDSRGLRALQRTIAGFDDANASTWAGLVVDVSRTDWKKLFHRDFFTPQYSAPNLPFEFWTEDRPGEPPQIRLTLHSVLGARRQQVELLSGLGRPPRKSWRADLHGSEAWRQVLKRSYRGALSDGQPAEQALSQAVMSAWPTYLSAMTVSTPYNVIDGGGSRANYLKRPYPRAASGQLIHDCGVHMLRSAYAFSGLPLSSYSVVVPNHVGLVAQRRRKTATGPTFAEGPVFVVHNASVGVVEGNDLPGVVVQWRAANPPDPNDAEQFLADLFASQYFRTLVAPTPDDVARRGADQSPSSPPVVVGVDAPYVLSSFPMTKATADRKGAFWKDYKKLVASTKLFNDDEGAKDFALKYLEYRAEWNRLFNAVVLPIWNERLPRAYRRMLEVMTKDGARKALEEYHGELLGAYQRIFQGFFCQ